MEWCGLSPQLQLQYLVAVLFDLAFLQRGDVGPPAALQHAHDAASGEDRGGRRRGRRRRVARAVVVLVSGARSGRALVPQAALPALPARWREAGPANGAKRVGHKRPVQWT